MGAAFFFLERAIECMSLVPTHASMVAMRICEQLKWGAFFKQPFSTLGKVGDGYVLSAIGLPRF
ncbi:MAG TPA: hypothetical protein VJ951_14510 [Bacteroidales bacterium]|nr:hypothetical protein [Bacteroidales bacterium]